MVWYQKRNYDVLNDRTGKRPNERTAETIPVIDLGPYLAGEPGALERAARELRFALTEIGFYFIVNHGVPEAPIRGVFAQAARFHALPLDARCEIRIDKHNVGYLPMRGDTLRTSVVQTVTKANLNEALVRGARPADRPSRRAGRPAFPQRQPVAERPARLPRNRRRLLRCAGAAGAETGARSTRVALDLPAAYFDGPFSDFQYKLRMTHYPTSSRRRPTTSSASPRTPTPASSPCSRPTKCPGSSIRTQSGKWIDAPAIARRLSS